MARIVAITSAPVVRVPLVSVVAVLTLTQAGAQAPETRPSSYTTWSTYLGSADSAQYTALDEIGPPWSEIVAYDLNTGDIRWRVPHGSVTAPRAIGIGPDSGAHWPRGAHGWNPARFRALPQPPPGAYIAFALPR